ncbi:MAG: hypothetical protein QXX12_00740 [Nanopusillaceae archaeon]
MSNPLSDPSTMRRTITAIIAALALIIIGAVIISVAQAIGTFILTTFQEAGANITAPNYISQVATTVGVGLTVTGAAIIVVIAVFILKALLTTATHFETT